MATTSAPDLATRIRAAIKGKASWVFIADSADGHAAIASLALAAAIRGTPAGDLPFGCFDTIDAANGRRATFSVLAVPKSILPAVDLARFLAAIGAPADITTDHDIIALASDPRFAAKVLEGIHAGTARMAPMNPEAN